MQKNKTTSQLDIWTSEILRRFFAHRNTQMPSSLRESIDVYTSEKLRETVEYAKANSPYYRERLKNIDTEKEDVFCWEDVPFMTPDDLIEHEQELLCVRPSEINRIVTLRTSGTTGKPKRIYFTEEDQQLTVDYFSHGMRLIVDKNDCVLILMPASSAGSIGLLLGKALREIGAGTIEYGAPFENGATEGEVEEILNIIHREKVTSVVALPTHMEILADAAGNSGKISLKSVLLSGEYVSSDVTGKIENAFGAKAYEHYGMTEMGLGCAVSCGHSGGYHIRETDLFVEIINGEIVFTTLTRKGMPFIRYRTGDFSRWITEDCPCGSVLKRLERVVPGEKRKLLKKGERNG